MNIVLECKFSQQVAIFLSNSSSSKHRIIYQFKQNREFKLFNSYLKSLFPEAEGSQ